MGVLCKWVCRVCRCSEVICACGYVVCVSAIGYMNNGYVMCGCIWVCSRPARTIYE